MFFFTTYFDKNYLTRGLVLYDSLNEHCKQFELYILCLDEFTFEFFQKNAAGYPEIKTLSLVELEASDSELKACKTNRSLIEYYFTLSPCLPLFILNKYNLPHICSLDADILFLDSPNTLFDNLNDYSIVITPHKFSHEIKEKIIYGIYNVSFQIFKNDETGIKCLQFWRAQCIEWCGDQPDEEKKLFADQKYLDNWTDLYPGKVKVLNDYVSGLAPWNLNNFKITKRGNKFYSNSERIIFYHFHDFKYYNNYWASNGLHKYKATAKYIVAKLYLNYWKKIQRHNSTLSFSLDQSIRYAQSNNLWLKLVNENYVYLKMLNNYIFSVQIKSLPGILKKKLAKRYA
ncbi:MAG: glycosyl transferase [Bacteroidota bacterium]|nr:glycosyl transferase [Bacteroidota bacterium]